MRTAMRRGWRMAAMLAAVAAVQACARPCADCGPVPALPDRVPGIDGYVRGVTRADDGGVRIHVEAAPGAPSETRAAIVSVPPGTRVYRQSGAALAPAAPADLRTGWRVRIWFSGPVMESFPVQATAGTLVILP